MARGVCVNCGKSVGGLMQAPGYICRTEGCGNKGKVFCGNCVPKHKSFMSLTPVCAQCGRPIKP